MPEVRIEVNLGGGSFKSQMKRADKSQAAFALLLGEQELAEERIGLKPLRGNEAQSSIALTDLAATLEQRLIKAD
jgi:histidyl-tRNA synthetase